MWWDLGFLAWGAIMGLAGVALMRRGRPRLAGLAELPGAAE